MRTSGAVHLTGGLKDSGGAVGLGTLEKQEWTRNRRGVQAERLETVSVRH